MIMLIRSIATVALMALAGSCAWAADYLHTRDFGAICDGVTDDTSALQAAFDAGQLQDIPVFIDAGTCLITAPLTLNSGTATVIGAGRALSTILVSGNFDGIQSIFAQTFEDFGIVGQDSATAGALINISPTAGLRWRTSFSRLFLKFGYDGIIMSNAVGFNLEGSTLNDFAHVGITISAPIAPDNGDSVIHGSTFSTSYPATAILQKSSGGLKVQQNKIIGGARGYRLALDPGVSTYDLLIVGNSIENQTNDGISMAKGSGTAFGDVVINGNQFSNMPYPINLNDGKAGFPTRLTIVGNTAYPGNNGTCIAINGAANFTVASNTCLMRGTSTGINIGSLSTKGLVTYNNIISATNSIINNSGSQTRVVP